MDAAQNEQDKGVAPQKIKDLGSNPIMKPPTPPENHEDEESKN